jgi:hypothetical protein
MVHNWLWNIYKFEDDRTECSCLLFSFKIAIVNDATKNMFIFRKIKHFAFNIRYSILFFVISFLATFSHLEIWCKLLRLSSIIEHKEKVQSFQVWHDSRETLFWFVSFITVKIVSYTVNHFIFAWSLFRENPIPGLFRVFMNLLW